jgi:hypothetical protein
MAGGIIFVIVMVVVVPAAVMMVGGVWSAVFGWLFPTDEPAPSDTAEPVETASEAPRS